MIKNEATKLFLSPNGSLVFPTSASSHLRAQAYCTPGTGRTPKDTVLNTPIQYSAAPIDPSR